MLNNKDDGSKRIEKKIDRMAEEAKEEIARMVARAHEKIEDNFKIAMLEMRLSRLEDKEKPATRTTPRKTTAPSP